MCGFDKRQAVNCGFAEFITPDKRGDGSVICRGKMNARRVHQTVSERKTLRRIMVSADDKCFQMTLGKLHQEIIKQFNRLCGRYGFVIYISRNEDAVRLFLFEYPENFRQDVFLIFNHGVTVHVFSKMKIG